MKHFPIRPDQLRVPVKPVLPSDANHSHKNGQWVDKIADKTAAQTEEVEESCGLIQQSSSATTLGHCDLLASTSIWPWCLFLQR